MFKKLFGGIGNHLNKVTGNSVLNSYCESLERMIQLFEAGEGTQERLRESIDTVGLVVAMATVSGMPPKSHFQKMFIRSLDKTFADCAGVSDSEVLEAIGNHVWYACSRHQSSIESKFDCIRNLNLKDLNNYNRFCVLRDKANRLAGK